MDKHKTEEYITYEQHLKERHRVRQDALHRLLAAWLVAGMVLIAAARSVERLGVLP